MPVAQTDTRQGILDAAQRIVARKGYAAVGINEILAGAGVPKGSFYHYFGSKDAFGEAMMQSYFAGYLADMDALLSGAGRTSAERLMAYWQEWRDTESVDGCQGRCLAVKLGAEVADLSEPMRLALKQGTDGIIDRIAAMIASGTADGSLSIDGEPRRVAQALYGLWFGASVMAKIHRDPAPIDGAMSLTRKILHI